MLARAATPNKPIELAIAELADNDPRSGKVLAVLAAGALGSWPQLLDALEDDKFPELRQAAAQAIQSLIARDPGNDAQVFDQLQAKLGYSDRLADETMTLLHGFPDWQWKRIQLLVEDDRLAVHLRGGGTHTGVFAHIAATRRRVSIASFAMWRVEHGRIAEASGTDDAAQIRAAIG